MEILRTPDDAFADLPDYPFQPHYCDIPAGDGGTLRLHYLDEGPTATAAAAEPVLLLHGEPSWSFLYRKMIPPLVAAGLRVVVPDLIGFGRSDKPVNQSDYSYQSHVDWLAAVVVGLDLANITLVGQDWGGLLGLRLATAQPDRFARLILANTGLPTGDQKMPEAFIQWQQFSRYAPEFQIGRIVNGGTVTELPAEVIAAYDAPFPDDRYKAGARIFPSLVPTQPDDPAAPANRQAWQVLQGWQKPVLTAFSDSDPITAGAERPFQKLIPGAQGRPHITISGAGHFLQEDRGEELAQVVIDFIRST